MSTLEDGGVITNQWCTTSMLCGEFQSGAQTGWPVIEKGVVKNGVTYDVYTFTRTEPLKAGAECHFLCHQLPAHLLPLLHSHQHHALCALDDAGPLPILHPEWLVCDHYQIDRQIEQKLAMHCGQLLIIDDLADRPHHGQLLLDQGPLRSAADYQSLAPVDCRLLLGTDYALLRPAYHQLARQKVSRWQRGLICFGGADPAGACLTTLNTLARLPWAKTISWTLVAGVANSFWPELQQRVAELPDLPLTLLRQSDQMAQLMHT